MRVLKAWWKPCSVVPEYKLTLEAVDDAGVVKFYIAIVFIDSVDGLWLESVFLIVDNERPLRQYHYLGTYVMIMYYIIIDVYVWHTRSMV